MNRCDECGFVYEDLAPGDVPASLRAQPARYADALRTAVAAGVARVRPHPGTWSALEYTCHVRDVLQVQRERLRRALAEDRPVFAPMGRDERAVEDRYNEQDPERVLDELAQASADLTAALEELDTTGWRRVGVYPWPETAERSMAWLARHTVHETVHHLRDVLDGLDRLRR